MGLDMYLNRRMTNRLVRTTSEDGRPMMYRPAVSMAGKTYTDVREIVVGFGYWRKANAIHGWFVREVQKGVDDCGTYQVSVGKLVELRELCRKVLANREMVSELLPTVDGDFFGSQEYDEYYFKMLEYTVGLLENVEESLDDFEYWSSW